MIYTFYNIVVEGHAESAPAVVGNHVSPVASLLDGTYATIHKAEILKQSAQLRAQPQWSCLAVDTLEDKNASCFFGIKPG